MRAYLTAGLLSVVVIAAGCAGRRPPPERHSVQGDCAFTVVNHTPHALEIRRATQSNVPTRATPTRWVGTINPGELVNDLSPCRDGTVRVWGQAIPQQVGAPSQFQAMYGIAELRRGERAVITFNFP